MTVSICCLSSLTVALCSSLTLLSSSEWTTTWSSSYKTTSTNQLIIVSITSLFLSSKVLFCSSISFSNPDLFLSNSFSCDLIFIKSTLRWLSLSSFSFKDDCNTVIVSWKLLYQIINKLSLGNYFMTYWSFKWFKMFALMWFRLSWHL